MKRRNNDTLKDFIFYLLEVHNMTAKEYLQQGYRLDQRINSKIAQVTTLRELATKATATLSDMPGSATPNTHRMEDIIVKMVDLENEINSDIDSLVDLKAEMVSVIKNVRNPELQTLLELRYLCFKTWEQIAVELGYSIESVYRLHREALKNIKMPRKLNSK